MSTITTFTESMQYASLNDRESPRVRFDHECVLIPELSSPKKVGILRLNSRTRLSTKSYALPLWPATSPSADKTNEEERERGRTLKVVLPSFTKPSRALSPPKPVTLPPCLRSPVSFGAHSHVGSPSHDRPPRRRSESLPAPSTSKIPLRDCCKACIPIVEAFLAEPTTPEKMSKGARRMQRSDCVSGFNHAHEVVKVDEFDLLRGEVSRTVPSDDSTLVEETHEDTAQQVVELSTHCFWDVGDEKDLFPLPSPRGSPQGSPSASQTNLESTCATTPTTASFKRASPLSNCYQLGKESTECSRQMDQALAACNANEPLVLSRTRSASDASATSSRKTRRPSLSSISESFSKSSVAVFKGIAGVTAGGSRGGGLMAL